MKNIIKKLKAIDRLQDEVEDHIWAVFHRYIKIHRINFNYPSEWRVDGSSIYFSGTDGCMGCYDPMSCSIDFKYFEDPDKEFELLEQEMKKEEERKKKREQENLRRLEKRELERLQTKYGKE